MSPNTYAYFDEAYFQDGGKCGTAYVNYKQGARDSQTFKEIATAVKEVFQPHRVLDVGCATGTTVRWLNELGCEAHGVDVSEWAVRNAEHPNVRLSSADNLDFPNDYFDLVISCHSMEHIPERVFNQSLAEITRVSSAFQFHMLPMIGTPPFDGGEAVAREQLRKDPTHQQLHSQEKWVDSFRVLGHIRVQTCLLFKNDTANGELSIGQFLLRKTSAIDESSILERSRLRNQRVFRELQLTENRESRGEVHISSGARLVFGRMAWKDLERKMAAPNVINLTDKKINLVVTVRGNPCNLRFAVGQDTMEGEYAHVGELQLTAKPGCNAFSFSVDQLTTLRGSPDYSAINHVALGGENCNSEIDVYLADQNGLPLLS